MAGTRKIAAVFSHPLHLVGFRHYTRTPDPTDAEEKVSGPEGLSWTPGRLETSIKAGKARIRRVSVSNGDATAVRSRWVNIFLVSSAGARWFAELYVDTVGNVHFNPSAAKDDRLKWRVDLGAPGKPVKQELPARVGGEKWFYSFIGTPFRLTDACIEKLEAKNTIGRLTLPLDLSRSASLVETADGKLAVPVLLMFDVARQLAHDIAHFRSRRLVRLGQDGEHDAAAPADVDAAKRYLLCKALKTMAETPDIDVESRFTPAGHAQIASTVAAHERAVARLDLAAEARAGELALWLNRDLFKILLDGCVPDDEHVLLGFMDTITAPLPQTGAGLDALGRILKGAPSAGFFNRYFKADEGLNAAAVANARRTQRSFASLLSTVLSVRLLRLDRAAHQVLPTLEAKFGSLDIAWELGGVKARIAQVETFAVGVKLDPGSEADRSLLVEVEAFVTDAAKVKKLEKFLGGADAAMKFFDALNVALAVRAYFNTPKAKKALRRKRGVAAAMGAAGLFASIMNRVFDLAGRETIKLAPRVLVRGVGFVAGAYALLVSGEKCNEAWSKSDYDAAVAIMASGYFGALSSIVGFVAAWAAIPGLGTIAIILGILGMLFYFVYLYVKDTALQTFAEHCAFGGKAGYDNRHPEWSPVPLEQLAGSDEHQIVALETLRRQFAITFGESAYWKGHMTPFFTGRILTGAVDAGTRFVVSWVWTAMRGSGKKLEVWAPHKKNAPGASGSFAPRLMVDVHKRLYFDLPLPPQAMKDCGYGDGQYGFRELTLHVFKTYDRGTKVGRVPLQGHTSLQIQEEAIKPDTSTVVNAWKE